MIVVTSFIASYFRPDRKKKPYTAELAPAS